MNNQAIVVKINKIDQHPNADRISLAKILGTQVIVGKDVKVGDVLVYVDSNMVMSKEFLRENNLYRHPELNKDDKKKGFFEDHGRVKAIKMRGEISDGFLFPMSYFEYLKPAETFNPGDEFDSVMGEKFCEKYLVPQNTPGAPGSKRDRQAKKRFNVPMFKEHFDMLQCRAA